MSSNSAQSQDSIRVATYNVGLKRSGPGLLLRDILSAQDSQVIAVRNTIMAVDPDILLLTRFDFDVGDRALKAFSDALFDVGVEYSFRFSLAPNSGVTTLEKDYGNIGPGEKTLVQGYGEFSGQGGMAILSRFPISVDGVKDFSDQLWRDLPNTQLPDLPQDEQGSLQYQLLSSVAHWDVPIVLPNGTELNILAYHATTPVFDGPEDFNGFRNQEETLFWLRYLEGRLPEKPPRGKFVILGDANLDPVDGEGKKQAIQALINSPFVFDPEPRSSVGAALATNQLGKNVPQLGDPKLDTANWNDDYGPGNLRVDYVLPSTGQEVLDAGIQWPAPEDIEMMLSDKGRITGWHGLVWVDIAG